MNPQTEIEDKELQGLGYPTVVLIVRPDPGSYYQGIVSTRETDDTTPDIILKDILRKYSRAWEKLAGM